VRGEFCDAAALRQANDLLTKEIALLKEEKQRSEEAAEQDQETAISDAAVIADLDAKIKEVTDATVNGSCLDAGDVDRLRGLWK
jgi:hypothetical protein